MFRVRITDNGPVVLINNTVSVCILKAYHPRLGDIRMCWNSFLKGIGSILEDEIVHLVKPVKDKAIHHTHRSSYFGNVLIFRLHELHIPLWIGANLILTTVSLYRFGPVEGNIKIGAPRKVCVSDVL